MRRSKTKALKRVNKKTFIRLIKAVMKHIVKARKRLHILLKGQFTQITSKHTFSHVFLALSSHAKSFFMSMF